MKPEDQKAGNGAATGGAQPGIGARVDQMNQDAQHLLSEAQGAVGDLVEVLDLNGRVQRHPYGMLAAAAGVGYVLGGGLFTPFTARLIRLGVRLAALPFVKDELLSMAEAAVDGMAARAREQGAPDEPKP